MVCIINYSKHRRRSTVHLMMPGINFIITSAQPKAHFLCTPWLYTDSHRHFISHADSRERERGDWEPCFCLRRNKYSRRRRRSPHYIQRKASTQIIHVFVCMWTTATRAVQNSWFNQFKYDKKKCYATMQLSLFLFYWLTVKQVIECVVLMAD